MLILNQNITVLNETQSFEDFKAELDLIKNEYYSLLNHKNRRNQMQTFSCSYNEEEINSFVYEEDWKEIENAIYWKIKTFYDFHSTNQKIIYKLKEYLIKLNPLWDACAAVGDFLSTIESTGNDLIDTSVLAGKTVATLLGFLKDLGEKIEYSKDFIVNMFGDILFESRYKNIIKLREKLQIVKGVLDNMERRFNIFFTLPIARRKVNSTLNTVNYKYEIAKQRLIDYNRNINWGSSWY